MASVVTTEKEQTIREIVLFKDYIIEFDSFNENKYLQKVENDATGKKRDIKVELKEILIDLFEVNSKKELKEILNDEWVIRFRDGTGDHYIDNSIKEVVIYQPKFVEYKKKRDKILETKRSIGKMMRDEKITEKQLQSVCEAVIDKISDPIMDMTKEMKEYFIAKIPEMIKNNELRLGKDDITDINKIELKEIIRIGKALLEGGVGERNFAQAKLGLSEYDDTKKEIGWSKYFELYGDYLLFGSVDLKVKIENEVTLNKELTGKSKNCRPDVITVNRYGFIDVVELKQSIFELFRYDSSHNNVYPSPKLSAAISQLNNYLMVLTTGLQNHPELSKGTESASGMLIIGSKATMLSKTHSIKYMENNPSVDINVEMSKYLRELNYSLSHIKVVVYDEILDNLEKFVENVVIK